MLFTDEAARSLEIRSWWDWVVSRSYVLTDIRVGLLSRREPVDGGTATFPWEARQDFNIAWKDYSWRSYEGQLSEMVDLLKRRGTRLAIVIFPFEPQLLLRTMRERRTDILAPQRRLKRLCRKYAVPCLDLYPSFARAYDQGRTLYRDGIHPNQDGHTLAATKVLRFLDAHRLLPAPAGSVAEGPR
jgi:predicted dehydrogenase